MNPNKALWEKGDFTRLAQNMRESGEALAKSIGVGPNDAINMRDPKTAAAYVRAAAGHESGTVSETDLAAGVNLAREQKYGGGGGQSDGTVHVTVDINHAPPGTRARATATGRATTAPPRVETPAVGL